MSNNLTVCRSCVGFVFWVTWGVGAPLWLIRSSLYWLAVIGQLSSRRFRFWADMLQTMARPSTLTTFAWIGLGLGLLGPFTYIWQDPRLGISIPPYTDSLIVGCAKSSLPGLNCWYRDLGKMLVSAPESILQSALTWLQSGPSNKETSSRAFSLQDMEWTFMDRGVASIGPKNT